VVRVIKLEVYAQVLRMMILARRMINGVLTGANSRVVWYMRSVLGSLLSKRGVNVDNDK